MRLCGVTSLYVPKNAIGWSKAGWRNTKRYPPPVRTSMSHETSDMPADFGTHQRLNNSGLLHASKTMYAGASNVRATTSSRSALGATAVRFMAAGLPSFPSGICLLLWGCSTPLLGKSFPRRRFAQGEIGKILEYPVVLQRATVSPR